MISFAMAVPSTPAATAARIEGEPLDGVALRPMIQSPRGLSRSASRFFVRFEVGPLITDSDPRQFELVICALRRSRTVRETCQVQTDWRSVVRFMQRWG